MKQMASHEHLLLASREFIESKVYWLQCLEGILPDEDPFLFRKVKSSGAGESVEYILEKTLAEKIWSLCRQNELSVYIYVVAAYGILISKYTGSRQIRLATPLFNKKFNDFEAASNNYLPVIFNISEADTFRNLLTMVSEVVLKAASNQHYPLSNIYPAAGITDEQQVFDTVVSCSQVHRNNSNTGLPFAINIHPDNNSVLFRFTSAGEMPFATDHLFLHLQRIISYCIDHATEPLSALSILTSAEKQQVLHQANNTRVDRPEDKTVIDLFFEEVQKCPDGIALLFNEQRITYKELDERVTQLAQYLRKKGVVAETLVALFIDRSPDCIISMLGILRSGGAYLPIDPAYPPERVKYMLDDSQCAIILTTRLHVSLLDNIPGKYTIVLADQNEVLQESISDSIENDISPDHLAYVIYTSGSTGMPKGVKIEHRALLNYSLTFLNYFSLSAEDRVIHQSSVSFDTMVEEVYPALLSGAGVIIIKEGGRDTATLKKYIEEGEATIISATPMILEWLNNELTGTGKLRYIISGGDVLHSFQIDRLFALVPVVNTYGPTESTVCATYHRCYDISTVSHIGRPIENVQVYILDKQANVLPVGVPGEMYIGGDQLARGYLYREALTNEKFIWCELSPGNKQRLYRTGDKGRWLQNNTLEFLGRADNQIKVRGYRIEPAEVEQVLQEAPGIHQSVVFTIERDTTHRQLVACVATNDVFNKETVLAYVKSRLPEYMVPHKLVQVDSIPLTPNGKINKKKLYDIAVTAFDAEKDYVAPRNEIEEKLTKVWNEVLSLKQAGIHDNFFELGGHSLLAMRAISAIQKETGIEIGIKDLFDYPTIASLSAQLVKHKTAVKLPLVGHSGQVHPIPLSFAQERVWFIDKLHGSVAYHIPAVFRLKGRLDTAALEVSLRQIVNRHQVLRTVVKEEDGKGYQFILPPGNWKLQYDNEQDITASYGSVHNFIEAWVAKPFDLSQDHMVRVCLVTVSEDEHILISVIHHIAFDAWSTGILVKELATLYHSNIQGQPALADPLPLQYADYALWQRQYLSGDLLSSKLAYWKQQLEGVQPLQLPTDFARPSIQGITGGIVRKTLDRSLADRLVTVCHEEGVTLFMLLLSAFKVLLYKYCNQADICVGSPIAGRQQQETDNLIGFFINTLALRSQLKHTISFKELLKQVKQVTLQGYEHQEVPFEKIVEVLGIARDMSRTPLFQVVFALQNTPQSGPLDLGDVVLTTEASGATTSQFDLIVNASESVKGLHLSITYRTDLYKAATIERILGHYENLLEAVSVHVNENIGRLGMLSKEETGLLLQQGKNTTSLYPAGKTIVGLFEEQVRQRPKAVAVVFDGAEITYKELHKRSNQLAQYVSIAGVQPEMLVPICMNRSIDLIIGILGILKAGGAYVPVDPAYPAERIRFILQDTGASIVVCNACHIDLFKNTPGIKVVVEMDAHRKEIEQCIARKPAVKLQPGNLAYVMYTSGSTGTPKGVMVEHRNVVSLVKGVDYIELSEKQTMLSTGSPSFDASTLEYWGMLLNGGRLVLCASQTLLDMHALKILIQAQGVTMMWFTSGWFNELVETDTSMFETLKTILVGGDRLSPVHVKQVQEQCPGLTIINGYGPTENTTFSLTYTIQETISGKEEIPIGRPLSNRTAWVLGEEGGLCATGISGELYVGGAGLSRGYLNHEELTRERFVTMPLSNETPGRLYKTGDIVKWLADGNIEFVGRVDDQVKIRGYRVEPGEIEHVLQQAPGVRQAVVIIIEEEVNHKRLVACVTGNGPINREAITSYLQSRMPDYMVPSLLMEVTHIPLTANGKTDKKKLQDLVMTSSLGQDGYEAPRNEVENDLAMIWQELLNVQQVGINGNFFELGGDSIITIQVVSRARRKGYELQVADIFTYQTIRQLAGILAANTGNVIETSAEQGLLTGKSGLLPVQQWYFEQQADAISHYNQSVLLGIDKNISAEVLSSAIKQLSVHHDALRFSYSQTAKDYEQWYGTKEATLQVEDMATCSAVSIRQTITSCADKWQRSLDITKGELVRAVLMQTPEFESHNRLLIVIHHLAVDGVSWRILLEDLKLLISQLQQDQPVNLGKKTSSYRQWYEGLANYAQRKSLLSQTLYWQQVAAANYLLPVDRSFEGILHPGDMQHVNVKLDARQTHLLLQEVPAIYHTEVNDLLLAALAATLAQWSRRYKVLIGLEGHGRENIAPGLDTSRTVGWFTAMYPVLLDIEGITDPTALIKTVKEQLRQIPGKGIGYGILKYINRVAALQGRDPWELIFNYLGQADNVVSGDSVLTATGESAGMPVGEQTKVPEKLQIDCIVKGGELVMRWSYSAKHYVAFTIEQVAKSYITQLAQLIAHCMTIDRANTVYTPSDFGLTTALTYQELDHFLATPIGGKPRKEMVETMYRLSALQEGLLFHGLYDPQAYINQAIAEISNLDTTSFIKSWNCLLQRHSILRSSFHHDVCNIPVQVVYHTIEMPVEILDYRQLDDHEQALRLEEYQKADMLRGIDFEAAPLMRITLIQMKEDRYRMIWTLHHLILDGWSVSVLVGEFLQAYEASLAGKVLLCEEEDRFEDFIRFIEKRDKEQEEEYWKNYLQGLTQGTLLPFATTHTHRTRNVATYQEEVLKIDPDTTLQIQAFAQQHRITVNTIMQGVWAWLLHSYTGSDHVAFGITVSGRPETLPGMENRIGMYINTIPLHATWQQGQSVVEWLQTIQQQQWQSREYQYTSLSDIQTWTGLKGDLFDSQLAFQNYPLSKVVSSQKWQLQVEGMNVQEQTTNYPLSIRIAEEEKITIQFIYKNDVLDTAYVKKIKGHFHFVLQQIMANTTAGLEQIQLLPETEVYELLHTFNNTDVSFPVERSIVDLFKEQVQKKADAVAIVCGETQLTFYQLDKWSDQFARYLVNAGVQKEALVPICLGPSVHMLVVIWGIWKAGAAYVPIDPHWPVNRIAYILENAGAQIVVTSTAYHYLFSHHIQSIFIPDYEQQVGPLEVTDALAIELAAIAYIIYTSGSTGTPKGVMIAHSNLLNYLHNCLSRYIDQGIAGTGSYVHLPYTFDASVTALLVPLLAGKCIVINSQASTAIFDDPNFSKYAPYDFLKLTPSHLPLLEMAMEQSNHIFTKKLVVGGEPLQSNHFRFLLNEETAIEIINEYGPTETTVGCSSYTVHTGQAQPVNNAVPIGKPLYNIRLYIVNSRHQLLPVGVTGELCISGTQVACGYLNQPDLTAQKFVHDPFRDVSGAALYKTGDLARWMPDGNLEFIGRKDDQVKIRGYRIELGEIEHALHDAPGVTQAVALVREGSQGSKYITGYVVTEEVFNAGAILHYLKIHLPEYMVPVRLLHIDSIPLTSNGKIDKSKLLSMDATADTTDSEHKMPRNVLEQKLVSMWRELLDVEDVSIYDDFFALGGHSLLAVRAVSAIRKQLGKEVDIKHIFDYPTISRLAVQLESLQSGNMFEQIVRYDRTDYIPLTFFQEQLWFVDRLRGTVQYHMPHVFRLIGPLNVDALQSAFREVVDRHEILRTVIREKDGKGYQLIMPPGKWTWQYILQEDILKQQLSVQQYIESFMNMPFDLAHDSMLRVCVIKLSEEQHMLVAVVHHIAFDGWSMSIMIAELTELYQSKIANRPARCKELPVQYADYAIWQRKYQADEIMHSKIDYWKQKLRNMEPLKLQTDYPRPAEQSIQGAVVTRILEKELRDALVELSQQQGVTLFMLLLAAFKVLLYRYTGQSDIYVGCPVAGRQRQEVEGLIGFFVNTLVLRSAVNGTNSFDTFLQQVKQTALDAYANQEVPFEKVVEVVGAQRDPGRHPLLDVNFQLINTPETGRLNLGDVEIKNEVDNDIKSRVDFSLDIKESQQGIHLQLLYCKDLYREETMSRMLDHYVNLLKGVLTDSSTALSQLPMLTPSEQRQLLYTFNRPSDDKTVLDLFEEQVLQFSDRVAVVFQHQQLTYEALNAKANQLALYIRKQGIREEEPVVVACKRSVECVIAIWAILKAGGTYVPVDDRYPDERIAYVLENTGCRLCLTDTGFKQRTEALNRKVRFVDLQAEWELINEATSWGVENINYSKPGNLAYIMYTSGSTGQPKGVMIAHHSLMNYLEFAKASYIDPQSEGTGSFIHLSMAFDASITALFVPLLSGKSIVISNAAESSAVFDDENFIRYAPFDFIKLTPSHLPLLEKIQQEQPDRVITNRLVIGGEALHGRHLHFLANAHPCIDIINEYGPTEATVGCSVFRLTITREIIECNQPIPIGKPLNSNVSLYITDSNLGLLPVGASGELCIGGVQLARGYFNDEALTNEKFISNPFSRVAGSRLYRTGDTARWLPDGNIEFIGRADDQVKVRGYRIELGEVENTLNSFDAVAGNCVVAKQDEDGVNKLVGYYLPAYEALKQREKELYQEQVSTWKELYETENIRNSEDTITDKEFDITGWNDSFTGAPIPTEHMREWLDDITRVILSEEPRRVLEIGCGRGLIYYQLAGRVQKYIGTDFSASSIGSVQRTIGEGKRNYGDTVLQVCTAHEVTLDNCEEVDTIILNSVIQYFPGEGYLSNVIDRCIGLLKGKGRIIIGDVRDCRLLKLFKTGIALEKVQEGAGMREFEWHVQQEMIKEEELCVSPAYFYLLKNRYAGITHVDIQWKQGQALNELSLYRYTVVLYVGIEREQVRPTWLSWNEMQDKQDIIQQLNKGISTIALSDVPNPRLVKERAFEKSNAGSSMNTVRELHNYLLEAEEACDEEDVIINSIMALARSKGYQCLLYPHADALKINVLITEVQQSLFVQQPDSAEAVTGTSAVLTNLPLFTDICSLLQKDIQVFLQNRLPDYMIPSDFYPVQYWPLTANGKIDRKFLSQLEEIRTGNNLDYQIPETPIEQQLTTVWMDLLHVRKIGRNDDFFELGGHSLLAIRVVSAIRKELQVEVSISDLFEHTTIANLAAFIERNSNSKDLLPSITIQRREGRLPLSFAQERLWFIDSLQGSVQYHMPWVFRLKGTIDISSLEASFRDIVDRHEILRTVIREEEGRGYQHINSPGGWTMRYITIDEITKARDTLPGYIDALVYYPFDLANDSMLRVCLIKVASEEYVLVAVLHHIAFDGWSISVMVQELVELYRSRSEKRAPVLRTLPVQYADYAVWQRAWLSGEVLATKSAYWKQQLQGLAPLDLPTDYTRLAEHGIKGGVTRTVIDRSLLDSMVALSQQEGATLFMALLSIFKIMLYRYTGQSDICVGSPIAGRQQQETEDLIGFFVNTLALRSQVNGNMRFRELLRQVKEMTLKAYEHQEIPFEKVVEILDVGRDLSRTPLFQVVFALQNAPDGGVLDLGNVTLLQEGTGTITSPFDLVLNASEAPNGLHLSATYRSDLFRPATIERMLGHFVNLLRAVLANEQVTIGELKMLSVEEEQLAQEFNSTTTDYPAGKTIVALFEEQVKKRPQAVAVTFELEEITYQELHRRSNQLAHYLKHKGVKKEMLIPICVDRSIDLIIGILGILKAGAAYVPIDPTYPQDRIAHMVSETGTAIVICNSLYSKLFDQTALKTIVEPDGHRQAIAQMPVTKPRVQLESNHLAYVMYTSGSTGLPKGVMVEHRNVTSLVKGTNFMRLSAEGILLSTGSPSFDASTLEYWGMLLNGGRLVLCSSALLLDTTALKQEIQACRVTTMWFTAGWFNELIESDSSIFGTLQTIVVGGDRLSAHHIRALQERYEHLTIINGYGPTENTTFSLTYTLPAKISSREDIPIGRPLSNRTAYVLDSYGRLCAAGIIGELYVGGAGLSRGYLNHPELTADKFLPDPFSKTPGDRLYRTGDMVRWSVNGYIEFIGRRDDQIKIRGYRVEPGEVEAVLQQAPGVEHAVVIAESDTRKNKRLIGYIVMDKTGNRELVMACLKSKLPVYMIPEVLVEVSSIPLTANGKVDKRALQELTIATGATDNYVPPRDEVEERLAKIWQQLLGKEQIGIYDNFFELGGHSLLVMRAIAAIRSDLNAEVTPRTFFQLITIEALAKYIKVNRNNFVNDMENFKVIRL
jgi:amino acid adenylation domain-containing protein/non-ribosomal peptide synthase protein (TIGR01720 family)